MKFAFEFKIDMLMIGNGITTVKNQHAMMYFEDANEYCPYPKMFLIDQDSDFSMVIDLKTLNIGVVICTEYAPLNQHHPFIVFRRNPDYSNNYYIRFTLYTEDSCAMNQELADFLDFMYEMKELFHDGFLEENEVNLNDPTYKYIKDHKVPFNSSMNEINKIMDHLGKMQPEKLPTGKFIEPEVPSKSLNDLAEIMNRPMFTKQEIIQILSQRNLLDPRGNCEDGFWED